MGFFSGRASFLRFRVQQSPPLVFGEEHLQRLAAHAAGRQRVASPDGIEIGWTAGEHVLDTDFQPAKNIVNDALVFDFRVDTDRLPADLLRAYTAIELTALTRKNPTGFPSLRQKREAKEAARLRLEQEAKDGRFRKRKCYPLLWERLSNEIWFASTSSTTIDRMASLLEQTFDLTLECMTAGRRAYHLAEVHARTRQVDDSAPSPFVPGITPEVVSWIVDERNRDFLGNEFLLWIWFYTDNRGDALVLADRTELTLFPSQTLTLECPRGQTGQETIRSDAPTRLPEARRAIQAGKLPRKLGLTFVRHNEQYELVIHAETLAISAVKLPPLPEDIVDPVQIRHERLNQLRHLVETLDLLYDAFIQRRLARDWEQELHAMQHWLRREERRAA
ncbi:MAG: hypothetical protein NZ703_06610 [Gemmataceae bacterium]|nr:hypothetical protein [Gemmataceae bacterium]